MSHKIGELSAAFESGSKGSKAIGYDSTGGTSYGKYQIASKVGTFNEFCKFASTQGPIGKEVSDRLMAGGNPNTGSTKGTVPTIWLTLCDEGKIAELEHAFIRKTMYDDALAKLNPSLIDMINNNWVLQDVLWSTVVQHGEGGAASIFNKIIANNSSITVPDLIKMVYVVRAGKFGKSTPQIQLAVKNRFKSECDKAIQALSTGTY